MYLPLVLSRRIITPGLNTLSEVAAVRWEHFDGNRVVGDTREAIDAIPVTCANLDNITADKLNMCENRMQVLWGAKGRNVKRCRHELMAMHFARRRIGREHRATW